MSDADKVSTWRDGVLADLCALSSASALPPQSGAPIYVGLEHIDSGAFSLTRWASPEAFKSNAYVFQRGDVLYGKLRPYLDKAVIAPGPGVCSTELLVLRPKPDVPSEFLLSILHTPEFVAYAQSSADKQYPRTSWSWISQYPILRPPVDEQKDIASILGKAQEAIKVQGDLVRVARELKQVALQRLFTRGLLGDAIKETEIGRIPQEWEMRTLGSLGLVKGGKRLPKGERLVKTPTPFPYIRVTDLRNNSVDISDLHYVPPSVQPAIARYIIRAADVYISIAGSIGFVGMIPDELDGAQLTENAARIVVNGSVSAPFLMRFLSSEAGQAQIRTATVKNAQPKLALNRIESLLVPVPSLAEQNEIGSLLAALDAKISHHEARQGLLRELFRALSRDLLTARRHITGIGLAALSS